jgi:hypothetical protein
MIYAVYLESACIKIDAIFVNKKKQGTKIWMQIVISLMIKTLEKDKGGPTTRHRALGRAQSFV